MSATLTLTTQDQAKINRAVEELKRRGVYDRCPRCGTNNWLVELAAILMSPLPPQGSGVNLGSSRSDFHLHELWHDVPPQPDDFGVVAVSAEDVGKPQYTAVGTTVVAPLPDQTALVLTMDKYDLLSEGNVSGERQARDLAVGVFLGALIGILSLV